MAEYTPMASEPVTLDMSLTDMSPILSILLITTVMTTLGQEETRQEKSPAHSLLEPLGIPSQECCIPSIAFFIMKLRTS